MKLLLAVVLPLYALDQATKWWIVRNFAPHEQRPVIPGFFDLCYWMNTGAAFSLGSGNNWFFVVISLVALAGLAIFAWRGGFPDRLSRIAAALVTAGILGNLTDRLLHGHVVDFLLFDLHVRFANPWPAFNVADSAICIAVGLFLIASFREGKQAAQIEPRTDTDRHGQG
jgi:signal peptidase II